MVSSAKSKDSDQISVLNKTKTCVLKRKRPTESFIGVRERKWGRWVSEIRVPHDQKRIWLGSYDTPEKAARAYDAAVYCLRGPEGVFNFPTGERPKFTEGLSSIEIKAVAARFASPNCMSESSSSSSSSCTTSINSPGLPIEEDESQGTHKELCKTFNVDGSHFIADAGISGSGTFWNESFLLDELFPVEPDSIWAILEETKHSGVVELDL